MHPPHDQIQTGVVSDCEQHFRPELAHRVVANRLIVRTDVVVAIAYFLGDDPVSDVLQGTPGSAAVFATWLWVLHARRMSAAQLEQKSNLPLLFFLLLGFRMEGVVDSDVVIFG